MKKQIFITAALALMCMPGLGRAATDGWKKTLEQKYLDSGIEGDDVILTSETYYFYDGSNRLVLETIPEDNKRTMYEYDDQNLCTVKTTMVYDEEAREWFGSNRETYTYYENGLLKTRTPFSYDWDGNLQPANRYHLYTYDESGNLTREEWRKVDTEAVLQYTVTTYQDGRKITVQQYGSEDDLTLERIYTYNPDGTLAGMLTKAFQFTVDPVNLTDKEREEYTYTDGRLTETIVLTPKSSDRTQWNYSKKYNYKWDPVSGEMVSVTYAGAKIDMQTGEFIKWSQSTRTEYTYSAALGVARTPGDPAFRIKSSKVLLAWEAPAGTAGLTGYNIYKNYALLATIGADETAYADAQVKEGMSYDYFVQSVYNDSIQNISSVVTVKVENPQDESPWKMTLEQKYIDSGVEGDDPYINGETYYFYDEDNNLVITATPDDSSRKTYRYDKLGSLAEVTLYTYDEEERLWIGSGKTVYTYYPDGKMKTSAEMFYDWETGEFKAPGMYTLYMYGIDGQPVRTESRKSEGDKLLSYVVYTYESGLKTVEQNWSVDDEDEQLIEETTFTYDSDQRLSETVTKAFQFTIDPVNLTHLSRELYTYENGFLSEMIVYQPRNDDNTQWQFKEKHTYRFDPASGKMLTHILSLADMNMETGEFLKWNQLTRTEYSYTDLLGADKVAGGFSAVADGDGVHLAWDAPANSTGLTAYHIFRDYRLLKTVAAGTANFTDTGIRQDVVYDYFVQPVYQDDVLLNITPVISVKGETVGIREVPSGTLVYGTEGGVEILGDGLQKVEIWTVSGTLVAVRTAASDRLTVERLERGTYVVSITARNGVYRQKVTVK